MQQGGCSQARTRPQAAWSIVFGLSRLHASPAREPYRPIALRGELHSRFVQGPALFSQRRHMIPSQARNKVSRGTIGHRPRLTHVEMTSNITRMTSMNRRTSGFGWSLPPLPAVLRPGNRLLPVPGLGPRPPDRPPEPEPARVHGQQPLRYVDPTGESASTPSRPFRDSFMGSKLWPARFGRSR